MATPDYGKQKTRLSDPADRVWAITKNDSADLAQPTRAIRCAGAGTVTFINRFGESCAAVFLAGETRALRAHRVMSTGTTATSMVWMDW